MTSKAENTFLGNVNKHLAPGVYAEKMSNPYRGGTPDVFYEATLMLWVEYKFVEVPKREDTLIRVELSALQRDWLQRNYDRGHAPWVIVGARLGVKSGGVIITSPAVWDRGIPAGAFMEHIQTPKEIAARISNRVLP